MSCEEDEYEFCIKQGQDELRQVVLISDETGEPIDISNFEIKSEIRVNFADVTPLETIDCEIIDAINGVFNLFLDHDKTTDLPEGEYFFDVKMISPANYVTRIIQGKVLVDPEVTR